MLNEYTGFFDEEIIPPIKHGAKEFLKLLAEQYEIKLFTTRNRLLASKWLIDNDLDEFISDVTNVKEPCWLYVDDRCLTFDGDFSLLIKKINELNLIIRCKKDYSDKKNFTLFNILKHLSDKFSVEYSRVERANS